jgi:hypothetical protein
MIPCFPDVGNKSAASSRYLCNSRCYDVEILMEDPFFSVNIALERQDANKAPALDESSASVSADEERHDDEPLVPSPLYYASQSTALPPALHLNTSQLHRELEGCLINEDWKGVEDLCEQQPSLARDSIVLMVCQGENSHCLPIHFAAGQKSTPISTIDSLVTAHPSSLLATESSGGRLPIHIAVLKGASVAVVRYLCEAQPQSMGMKDQEGNLPLHYAAMYSSNEIVQLMVKAYPLACKVGNRSDRLPLHLLCGRCWDQDPIAVDTIQAVLTEHCEALRWADRNGRLPLHVCCTSQNPRADIVQLLVPAYPEALLARDQSKGTPLDLARMFPGGGVVLAYLQDCTNKERRRKYRFMAPFKHVGGKIAHRRHHKPDVDALHLHYSYG